jgi:hypothetical protein
LQVKVAPKTKTISPKTKTIPAKRRNFASIVPHRWHQKIVVGAPFVRSRLLLLLFCPAKKNVDVPSMIYRAKPRMPLFGAKKKSDSL